MRQSPLLLGGQPILAGGFIFPPALCPPNPGQPTPSSTDESPNPIYYNRLHSPLPITLPSPTPASSPPRPSSGGGRCPLKQCHVLSACCPGPGLGMQGRSGAAATPGRCLLWGRCTPQTACRTAEMLSRRQADTQASLGRGQGSPPGVFHPGVSGSYSGLLFPTPALVRAAQLYSLHVVFPE